MTHRARSMALFLLVIYLSLNWGGLVFHQHVTVLQTQVESKAGAQGNCPLCQWGMQNVSNTPSLASLAVSFVRESRFHRLYQPLFPLLWNGPVTARAPPLA